MLNPLGLSGELSAGDEWDADKQKAARMSLSTSLPLLAYPDPVFCKELKNL